MWIELLPLCTPLTIYIRTQYLLKLTNAMCSSDTYIALPLKSGTADSGGYILSLTTWRQPGPCTFTTCTYRPYIWVQHNSACWTPWYCNYETLQTVFKMHLPPHKNQLGWKWKQWSALLVLKDIGQADSELIPRLTDMYTYGALATHNYFIAVNLLYIYNHKTTQVLLFYTV